MNSNITLKKSARPLVVDLDGTLIKTNLLFECANNLITRHPLKLIHSLGGLKKGKSYLKAELADASLLDIAMLPYNPSVISFLEQQKVLGRTIVLATVGSRALADAVAKYLGFIDEVMATEGGINFKSETKRDLLVARFGEKGFDYIGNSAEDLPVWRSAHKAYVLNSSSSLIKKVCLIGNLEQVIPNDKPAFAVTLLQALRCQQWVKNLLIFVPALATHNVAYLANIIDLIMAFMVFCISASSVYLLNDLIDVADDRHHQNKRRRPFAAGNLSLLLGWLLWPILLVFSFVIAGLMLPKLFCVILASYFILTMAYSFRLKQTAILDVLTLAILYTLRIIAGAFALNIPLSFWLMAFSLFIFLSLAFIKRFSELKLVYEESLLQTPSREKEIIIHVRGRGYIHQDLESVSSMGISAGYLAVLVLALYIQDAHTLALYPSPQFIWLACPLLLYWISRAWLIAIRGKMHHDPIIFAITDRMSWIVGVCFLVVFGLAMIRF